MTRLLRLAVLLAAALPAQDFTQRGYLDTRVWLFPQTAPGDSGRLVVESLLRYEAAKKLTPWLRVNGSFDARTDTHRMTQRSASFLLDDRSIQRPAFSLRRLSATASRGGLTAEVGKQFIRWGKADILNPTDRFAPRDFLTVLDTDFLGVWATRLTYEKKSNTIDLVWSPRLTPTRTPLLNQRWTVLPPELAGIPLRDLGARYPGGSQFGIRFNHVGQGFEASGVFFEGYNHLPLIEGGATLRPFQIYLQRYYPKLRLYGLDAAVPLPWFTVKGEAAYFTSSTPTADEYVIYVVQLERTVGEWIFVGGYAGEVLTKARNPIGFNPDRGFARTFLGRAAYTLGPTRNIAIESAVRQTGDGYYLKAEYSHLFGQHWRVTWYAMGLGGERTDFLGQYRRNSNLGMIFRYSF